MKIGKGSAILNSHSSGVRVLQSLRTAGLAYKIDDRLNNTV